MYEDNDDYNVICESVMSQEDKEEIKSMPKNFTKLEKLYSKISNRINDIFSGERIFLRKKVDEHFDIMNGNVRKWQEKINIQIDGFTAKHTEMYNTLMRTFLTNLEERIYHSEISNSATLKMFVDFVYVSSKQDSPDGELKDMKIEDFEKIIFDKHQEIMKNIQRKNVEKLKNEESKESN